MLLISYNKFISDASGESSWEIKTYWYSLSWQKYDQTINEGMIFKDPLNYRNNKNHLVFTK